MPHPIAEIERPPPPPHPRGKVPHRRRSWLARSALCKGRRGLGGTKIVAHEHPGSRFKQDFAWVDLLRDGSATEPVFELGSTAHNREYDASVRLSAPQITALFTALDGLPKDRECDPFETALPGGLTVRIHQQPEVFGGAFRVGVRITAADPKGSGHAPHATGRLGFRASALPRLQLAVTALLKRSRRLSRPAPPVDHSP